MPIRIIKRDPVGQDKEVVLEIDPVGSGSSSVQTYSVKGKAVNAKSVGVAGVTMNAYHVGITTGSDTFLGTFVTNASGDYVIHYTTDLLPAGKLFADLVVKAFDASTLLAKSPIYADAVPIKTINLLVSNEKFVGLSEYTQIKEKLDLKLVGLNIAEITLDGMSIIASALNLAPKIVADYIKSIELHGTYSTVSEEVFYGLFRYGLPYSSSSLIDTTRSRFQEALESITVSNIIDPDLYIQRESILDELVNLRAANWLIDPISIDGESYLSKILQIAGISSLSGERGNFAGAYDSYGPDDDFWDIVQTANVFIDQSGSGGQTKAVKANNVKRALQIGVICQEHVPLISLVYSNTSLVEEIGGITPSQWMTYIDTTGVGVPDIEESALTILDKSSYVDALMTAAEKAFPTEVLRKYMSADVAYNGSPIHNFLNNHLDFDITKSIEDSGNLKESSPRKYFSQHPEIADQNLKNEVFMFKRLWHLVSGYDKLSRIKLFISEGLLSASQISNIGSRTFIKKYASVFGAAESERIFKTAVKRTAAAAKMQASYNPAVNTVSTKVFTDTSINQTDVDNHPNLAVLFGSQDYCECKHCRSSFSPAAYLIDLLAFLKQTQVYDDAGNPSGTNAWEIFKFRRPEFQNIELSCDNTNITLPYIDIVNEVLEHAVVAGNLSRQTTLDSKTLMVRPEHLNVLAYQELSRVAGANPVVYPWLLPFHLWNEEAHAYLDILGISPDLLVTAFEGNTPELGLSSALIYLNISSSLKDVLLDNTSFTNYYGNANASTLQSVSVLLQRSGIDYTKLLSLIETKYINPNEISVVFTPPTSCKLVDATLAFTASEYYNLHRFERLRIVLNWNISELDAALSCFGHANINNTAIIKLAGIKKLTERFKLPVMEVLSWFGTLSEKSYGSESSYYNKIFLNPLYNSDAAVRVNFEAGTGIALLQSQNGPLDASNSPVLLGVLRLKASDLMLLINAEISDGTSVDNFDLAHLYRVASFTRAIKISIQDYLDLKRLTGLLPVVTAVNPPATFEPNDTLKFLDWWDDINASAFSLKDLRFLFLHQDLGINKVEDPSLLSTISSIRSKVQIRLSEVSVSPYRTREDLLNLFLIFLSEENAIQSLEIVDNVSDDSSANDFIDTYWTGLVSNKSALKLALTNSGGALTDAQERRNEIFAQLHNSLISELLLNNVVLQALSGNFNFAVETVDKLMTVHLDSLELFLDLEFVFSTGDVSGLSGYQNQSDSIISLVKMTTCLNKLKVQDRHIDFILGSVATTNWFDLGTLPVSVPNGNISGFGSFLALIRTFKLEKQFGVVNTFSIIDHIQSAQPNYTELSKGTGWNETDAEFLDSILNSDPGNYDTEVWLVKLQNAFSLINKLGMSAEQLSDIFSSTATSYDVDVTYEQAQSIQTAVKSNFSDGRWNEVAVDTRNKLRQKQRDALAAYLIGNNSSLIFNDINSLYEYFLLDIEMEPCMQTSRIKLAISSIQLWVQRIRMDLEPDIKFGQEELDEWQWRKNYRVWEAARKVFLYPENWLEPELRDDKSPFFKELEDELLQNEVNSDTAETAYLNYLTKLDDVAVLEISGIYREEDRNILHVFARTKNSPHFYYYRKQVDGFRWTAWEKIDLDIEGDHLIPVVFNRRPMIFWPILSEVPKPIDNKELTVTTSNGAIVNDVPNKIPVTYAEVKMAYSEWKNNKWQPKKISKTSILSTKGFSPANYFFKTVLSAEGLSIDIFYQEEKSTSFYSIGGFLLSSCTADIERYLTKQTATPAKFTVKNTYRNYMKILEEVGNDQFAIVETIKRKLNIVLDTNQDLSSLDRIILKKTPGQFKITYPVTGVDLLSEVPFFFEDKNRIFFVQPSEEVFERQVLMRLPLSIIRIRKVWPISAPEAASSTSSGKVLNSTNTNNTAPIIVAPDYNTNGGTRISDLPGDHLQRLVSQL